MAISQSRLDDQKTIVVPKRWNIPDNNLIIFNHPVEYYCLRMLAMSLIYDDVRIQWAVKKDPVSHGILTKLAEEIINVFKHNGWAETRRNVERVLKEDPKEKGTRYEFKVNISHMEKKG